MIKITPSNLENYRLAKAGLYNIDGDALEGRILGEFETTEASSRGTAFHSMIEHGPEAYEVLNGEFQVYEKDLNKNWNFGATEADLARKIRERYPDIVHEVKGSINFQVAGFEVAMPYRIDGINLLTLCEFKTTGTAPTYLKYYDSIQWRCYLLALPEALAVDYSVVQFNTKNQAVALHEYTYQREQNNDDQVINLMAEFAAWINTRPAVLEKLSI